jgi:undecaprenyl-diphosphatase
MNHFDYAILHWFNQFVGRSGRFDSLVQFVSDCQFCKGSLFLLVIWWFWFAKSEKRTECRQILVATLAAAFVSIALGRLLAFCMPFRLRPSFNPASGLVYHQDTINGVMRTWSAFPSDHAMMFAALATGFCFISRSIGIAAFVYGLIVIDLPRVYLGLHHPTDVLAGAFIGAVVGCVLNLPEIRSRISSPVLRFQLNLESAFYAAFFLISTQIATMFSEPREIVADLIRIARGN